MTKIQKNELKQTKLSFYLIGKENLLLQCANILLKQGHTILGIFSKNIEIRRWAQQHHIPPFRSMDIFQQEIEKIKCDYLLSIVNEEILSENLTKFVRKLSINYHDSLLPAYAGVHATSWAILNGEKMHGISWHLVDKGIDTGAILKQTPITIDSNETALSLNLKCYEAAILSFSQLLEEIEDDSYTCLPQNLEKRSYYSLHKKPPANGFINWTSSALEIDRLVRALDLGPYTNKLSTPKFILGDQILIATKCRILSTKSNKTPGTILQITPKSLKIATGTYAIILSDIHSLYAEQGDLTIWCKKNKIKSGHHLLLLNKEDKDFIEKTSTEISKYEPFWVKQFFSATPTSIGFLPAIHKDSLHAKFVYVDQVVISNLNLKKLAKSTAASNSSNFILAIWLIYLFRINNQEKVTISLEADIELPIKKLWTLIFENTKPLQVNLTRNMTFSEVCIELEKKLTQLVSKKLYLKDIQLRYPEINNHLGTTLAVLKGNCSIIPIESVKSHFIFWISTDGQSAKMFVRENLINPNFSIYSKNIKHHIKAILQHIVSYPNAMIGFIPLLTEDEYKKIVINWNNPISSYPKNKTVIQLFEDQVKRTPENIAVSSKTEKITYNDLNNKSNQLAHYLVQQGVCVGAYVGIFSERSIEVIISMLAIIKAGAVYVPIDPNYPKTRIAFIVNDCNMKICLSQSYHVTYLRQATLGIIEKIVPIDESQVVPFKESIENPSLQINSNDLIYIIYTSGSTGKPKGVEITHKNVVRLTKKPNYIEIGDKDCVAHAASPTFDAATFEIWGALLNGAKLAIFQQDILLDAKQFKKQLHEQQVNILWLTATVFSQFMISTPNLVDDLKFLLVGGDVISPQAMQKLLKRKNRPSHIINGYGPTENTTFTTYYPIEISHSVNESIPIGSPVSGTKIYVCDKTNQLLPIGVIGELYVGGDGLARGYLNRPALTAQKFITDPFSNKKDSRLYKTGDRVRWLPSGHLEFVGRTDNQLKIRGFRVEIEEIEHILINHACILDAVVLAQTKEDLSKKLIAFVVIKNSILKSEEQPINSTSIRNFLREKLPEYMIPNNIYILETFPLTEAGKVDRNKLLLQCEQKTFDDNLTTRHLPENQIQQLLSNIWCHVFNLSVIDIHDNFFDLGGDSILAMQIAAEASRLGFLLSVKLIFQYQTIEKLSQKIEIKVPQKIRKIISNKVVALTPIQEWFFSRTEFVKPQYFSHTCWIEISSSIEVNKIHSSLQKIAECSDAFYLRFCKKKDGWKQFYSNNMQNLILFRCIDKIEISKSNLHEIIYDLSYKMQDHFNLEKGPLFCATLIKKNNHHHQHILLMTAHHLMIDGVSWRILLNHLDILVNSNEFNLEKNLNTQTFYDWSKAISDYTKKLSQPNEMYWNDLVKSRSKIPCTPYKGENFEKDSVCIQTFLKADETRNLIHLLVKNYSIKIDEFLLSALAYILGNWMQSNCVLINIERHGREDISSKVNCENIIGWFTSLFPIKLNIDAKKSISENIIQVIQQIHLLHKNGLDYGALRFLKKDKEYLEIQPQISFNYWGRFDQSFSKSEIIQFKQLRFISHPENKRIHLIDVEAVVNPEGKLQITWIYNKNFHKKTSIQKLAHHYMDILHRVLSDELKQTHFSLEKVLSSNGMKLTPMQKGLLFHTIDKPGCEAYAVQLVWELYPRCNLTNLRNAFNVLIKHYPILRTSFKWEGLTEPLQYIQEEANLLWHEYDWLDSKSDSDIRLSSFLKIDRQANFSLSNAPLMRVTIIKSSAFKHTIIVTLHHILIDGWSIARLINELGQIYSSLQQGVIPNLQEPVPFSNYIDWLHKQDLNRARHFWKKYLLGFHTPTALVLNKTQNANDSINYSVETLCFSDSITKKIKKFCQVQKITISTLMQGIWGMLLSFYNDSKDIVFGVTLSLRPLELNDANEIVGPLINTVPLRIQIKNKVTIGSYLNGIQNNFINIAEHAYAPLTQIHSWSQMQTGKSLFESLIVVENYPMSEIPGLMLHFSDIKIFDPTHYPLVLTVILGDKLQVKFNYDLNCITTEKLTELLKHFNAITTSILQDANQYISNLTLLSSQEERKILELWNNTKIPLVNNKTVTQLIEEQAAKTPHKNAVVFKSTFLTYDELNRKSNQLAHHLKKQGAHSEMLIALCVKRGLNLIIGLLGIIKSGAAYVPIDPDYPQERVSYMLENSQSSLLLTESKWLKKHKEILPKSTKVVLLDNNLEIGKEPSINPATNALPHHLMYVIYTSGSTGNPKGVLIEHHSFINFLLGMQQVIKLTSKDKWLAITPISFDISALEIYLPLVTGGLCVIASEKTTRDGKQLSSILDFYDITIMQATPMSWELLIESGWTNQKDMKILCGGEALTPKLSQKLICLTDSFLNLYGPTETTIWSTINHITRKTNISTTSFLPIGKPIANTQVYVLNSQNKINPVGITGELYIGGKGVARGYLNQEKLTREKFILNPFQKRNKNNRLYKTGDLVRWQPDGLLEYIKRLDDQIKIRGFRIELGEIQAKIDSYASVRQSVVLGVPNKLGSISIVACCTLEKSARFNRGALLNYLRKFLPNHMIPSQFFIVKQFPLTPNKKIDKDKLTAFIQEDLFTAEHISKKKKPKTLKEKSIAKIWSKVLLIPYEDIGCEDNFFELGGHSLNALQVISEISQLFSINLEVHMLFEHPTISKLVKKIQSISHPISKTTTKLENNQLFKDCLVPLKPSGNSTPLFLIHPIGGTIFWYVSLTKYMDKERPVFALQDPGLETDIIPFSTVSEMATYYIKVIQKIQPHGPYFIAGASAGANMCMEIAHQLELAGEQTAFIGLLDGWAYYPQVLENQEIFESIMLRQYHIMQKKFENKGIKMADRLLKLQWKRSKMHNEYKPPRLNKKLFLFKAEEIMPIFRLIDSPDNHWQDYSTLPIEISIVPGDHETMFNEKNVQILARILSKKINQL